MKKEFVCISCPMGCPLTVWEENGEVMVTGNTCPRGKTYGVQEFTAPQRTVTSSVPVKFGTQPMCSVKTAAPIPKEMVPQVLCAVRKISVKAPVQVGDVVLHNVSDTGVDVIATRKVEEKKRA